MYCGGHGETLPCGTCARNLARAGVKHSPGPFRITAEDENWRAVCDAFGVSSYQVICDADGTVVALVVAHSAEHDAELDTESNAKLLAAAPDLLSACRGLLAIAETGVTSLGTIRMAHAAIEKATGGAV